MKYILPIAFFSLLSLVALAQETTVFNRNYPYEYYYRCNNMQIVNGNYVLAGGIKYENAGCNQWLQGLHITHIDNTGELQNLYSFSRCNWDIYNDYGCFNVTGDSSYVFSGMEYSLVSPENNIYFLKLSTNYDTTCLVKFHEDTLTKRCWNMAVCNNGDYILVGTIDSTHSEYSYPDYIRTQTLLICIGPDGYTKWEKSYAFNLDLAVSNWQEGMDVIETWDKGFLITGLTYNFTTHLMFPYIMKTDSLGNFKWKQFFSLSSFETPQLMDIIETRDSCYVVCGARAYGEAFSGLYPYDGWIYKFDTNGVGKWQKTYREHHPEPGDYRDTIYCYFYSMCELPDGRIAVTGHARKTPIGSNMTPFIYMLNAQGDSLFSKHFCGYPPGDPNYVNDAYPNKIVQTEDGGFAIGGWGIYWEYIDGHWEQPERIFLIKTDSVFNDIYTYVLPPLQSTEDKLTVYPNPAAGWVTVTVPVEDVLELYGSTGSVALKTNVSKGENRIALTGLQPGMYLARLKNTGFAAKLVVQ
ncbi:MAG TPA: T9SS type A sorting domain-containing protein [Bacteroidales bacterium]|nr:T9SS type A sorting domain-containing protein [Bacteroidales bacterium]HQL69390.1 T9SS type A sorting domain-containing protein [Bacteroidales bacterium]